ncbi:hypothetical protein PCK2_000337 [Pneumocystis canis]|nr:hypothetical protein PCK2_000337 [Pneumocystis canis]
MTPKKTNEKKQEFLSQPSPASLDAIADIELEFEKAEVQLLKYQIQLFNPLYDKRASILRKIPKFWPIVLEAAPGDELSVYISPEDANVLEHLIDLRVYRPNEDPRDINIVFEFEPNEYLETGSLRLEKLFTYSNALQENEEEDEEAEIDLETGILPILYDINIHSILENGDETSEDNPPKKIKL